MPAGTHKYSFNYHLPENCPTSCEGKYGNTRYALWLTIDRADNYDNEFSKPVTVLKTVDLNLKESNKVSMQVHMG